MELIKINKSVIANEEVNSVNAREIHEFLEVRTKFADWIKRAIKKYDFVEGEDFLLSQKRESGNNAIIIDYIVTMDMAKELSMLENNKKGKETRKYFIEVEKKARSGAMVGGGQILEMMAKQNGLMFEFIKNQAEQTDKIINLLTKREEPQKKNYLSPDLIDNIKLFVATRAEEAVQKLFIRSDVAIPYIYGQINRHFDVKTYYHIPYERYEEALIFIANINFTSLV